MNTNLSQVLHCHTDSLLPSICGSNIMQSHNNCPTVNNARAGDTYLLHYYTSFSRQHMTGSALQLASMLRLRCKSRTLHVLKRVHGGVGLALCSLGNSTIACKNRDNTSAICDLPDLCAGRRYTPLPYFVQCWPLTCRQGVSYLSTVLI